MNKNDYEGFTSLLVSVGELYGKPVSETVVPIWWEALKNYDFKAVRQAFGAHATNPDNGQFMPKPADIIRMMQGTSQDASMRAWSKFEKAVKEVGPYQNVVFDDAIIHLVVQDMGGWIEFGNKTDKEWPFVQREFENRYKGYAARPEKPSHVPELVGIAYAHNVKEGYETEPARLLGNPKQAQIVYEQGKKEKTQGWVTLDFSSVKRIENESN